MEEELVAKLQLHKLINHRLSYTDTVGPWMGAQPSHNEILRISESSLDYRPRLLFAHL